MDSSGLRKVFLKLLIVAKARINDGFCYIGWDLDRYKLARPLLRLHNPRWSSKDDKLRVGDTHLFKVVSFQPAWKRSLASLHRRCSRKTLRTQSTRGGQSLWRWIVHNLIDTESRNCKKRSSAIWIQSTGNFSSNVPDAHLIALWFRDINFVEILVGQKTKLGIQILPQAIAKLTKIDPKIELVIMKSGYNVTFY